MRSSFTSFKQLYLPETLFNADLLVSMPKLKTHHWAGVTLSMKNLFGIIPGTVYGWPKNILHWQGIENSILDINSSLPLPQFAIVDGIVGMEGNGPLQGQAKNAGVLIFGDDFVSVDASAARLMKLEPRKVIHLAKADAFLGNLAYDKIGEQLERVQQDFDIIAELKDLKKSPVETGAMRCRAELLEPGDQAAGNRVAGRIPKPGVHKQGANSKTK